MNTGSKVTVLIAHDSPLLAAGLAAAFRTRGEFEVLADTAVPAELTADVIVADFDNGR